MRSRLERYDAGERRQVWDELHGLGPLSAQSDETRRDAERVARRTMERAAENTGTLYRRLVALGFCFRHPEWALAARGAQHIAEFDALIKKVGAVPPSLEALFAVSGYVCFRGWLPSWGSEAAWTDQLVDPFEFLPDVRSEIERVEDELVEPEDRGFRLSIAGDYLHKNNFSGGGQTEVPLPSDEADARVFEDDGVWFHHYASIAVAHGVGSAEAEALPRAVEKPIWLVDYLRKYFDAGGFRRVAGTASYPEDLTRQLAEGLLEI